MAMNSWPTPFDGKAASAFLFHIITRVYGLADEKWATQLYI